MYLILNSKDFIYTPNLLPAKDLKTASSSWASLEQWQDIWTQYWGKWISITSLYFIKTYYYIKLCSKRNVFKPINDI